MRRACEVPGFLRAMRDVRDARPSTPRAAWAAFGNWTDPCLTQLVCMPPSLAVAWADAWADTLRAQGAA